MQKSNRGGERQNPHSILTALANEVHRESISRASCLKMELQADKPQASSILPCLHISVHTISKRDALQAYKSAYYHHRTLKKGIFLSTTWKFAYCVQWQCALCKANKKGGVMQPQCTALFLEDMQTFPQSANGNRLFPDNRAPS